MIDHWSAYYCNLNEYLLQFVTLIETMGSVVFTLGPFEVALAAIPITILYPCFALDKVKKINSDSSPRKLRLKKKVWLLEYLNWCPNINIQSFSPKSELWNLRCALQNEQISFFVFFKFSWITVKLLIQSKRYTVYKLKLSKLHVKW